MMLKLSCVLLCLIPLCWAQNSPRHIEIFSFSAPPESFQQNAHDLDRLASASKRHQQVIFIKNPENRAYEKALENLATSASEQKTHIYVLNKEPNHNALAQRLQQSHQQTYHKPEVKFIKYKQPGEAQSIQSNIVQQYGGNPNSVSGRYYSN